MAYGLAIAAAYVELMLARGMAVDDFAPRISFFFNSHSDFFEEIAKFRAARRIYARIMKERFGARNPESMRLRFHCQTAAATLTRAQPMNNVVRTALQALSAVLGGAQSLHTNGLDEAYAIPSEEAMKLALRTQQIIAEESRVSDVIDPLGGSYYVESLTDQVEEVALSIMAEIDELGGAVRCIETGWTQRRIADSAFEFQKRVESGERVVVGLNKFTNDAGDKVEIMKVGPRQQAAQARALKRLRARRDQKAVERHLAAIESAARGTDNLMPPLKAALADYVTIGECCEVLRGVFGEYRPPEAA
jgi:methylmalonyl-CoA mutase N-terminal domain/subunit